MFLYETMTWLCKRITNMTMCTFWWKCHVSLTVEGTFSKDHIKEFCSVYLEKILMDIRVHDIWECLQGYKIQLLTLKAVN